MTPQSLASLSHVPTTKIRVPKLLSELWTHSFFYVFVKQLEITKGCYRIKDIRWYEDKGFDTRIKDIIVGIDKLWENKVSSQKWSFRGSWMRNTRSVIDYEDKWNYFWSSPSRATWTKNSWSQIRSQHIFCSAAKRRRIRCQKRMQLNHNLSYPQND